MGERSVRKHNRGPFGDFETEYSTAAIHADLLGDRCGPQERTDTDGLEARSAGAVEGARRPEWEMTSGIWRVGRDADGPLKGRNAIVPPLRHLGEAINGSSPSVKESAKPRAHI
jgi:hypothetical protein